MGMYLVYVGDTGLNRAGASRPTQETNMIVTLGKAGSITVDVDALRDMPQVEAYIFNYGLKQMLNDVHAGEKDPEKKLALSLKKLDSLMRGEVAQARVGQVGNPLERKMRELAEADLKVKLQKIGKKPKDFDKQVWADVVTKQVKARETAYQEAAMAILAVKVADLDESEDEFDILGMLEGNE